MARIRTIKPQFWEDTDLAELPFLTRLFYIGVWNFMDRNGVCEANPRILKRNIFPYDDVDVPAVLAELISAGFLISFRVGEKEYIKCPAFTKHQHIRKDEDVWYPDLPDSSEVSHSDTTVTPVSPRSDTEATPPSLQSAKEKEKEKEKEEGKSPPPLPPPEQDCFSFDPVVRDFLKPVARPIQDLWVSVYGPDKVWIEAELRKAAIWWVSNPHRRKPGDDVPRFAAAWLSRAKNDLTVASQAPPSSVAETPKKKNPARFQHEVYEDLDGTARVRLIPIGEVRNE